MGEKPPCSIEGCDKPVYSRTWCRSHYDKWHKHGDPEWKKPAHPTKRCKVDQCDNFAVSRSLCDKHYSQLKRGTLGEIIARRICGQCGEEFQPRRKNSWTCDDPECRRLRHLELNAQSKRKREPKRYTRTCKGCQQEFETTSRGTQYCSPVCPERKKANWGKLRVALDTSDYDAILDVIGERSRPTEKGCWEWQGTVDSRGYGRVGLNKAGQFLPHRLALEAKRRSPLGPLAAHHKCANARCVNPDHLEAVTDMQNVGEMMARSGFLKRIAELEAALRELAPNHRLL